MGLGKETSTFIKSKYGASLVADSEESTCNSGDPGSIPGSERSPGEGKWLPTPVFLPGEFRGQRSLVGYSPWGCKELDTTKQLTLSDICYQIYKKLL